MEAKVVKEFRGRPDHMAKGRIIKVGEVIEGELAAVAVREKWAEEIVIAPDGARSLDDMSVNELTAFAEEKGIDLGDAKKKGDIRAAIDLALEGEK